MLTSLLTMVLGKLLSGSSDQVAACNVALRTQLTTTTTTMGCIRTMTALQMNSPASLLSPASPPRITTTAAATPRKPSFVSNPQVKPSSEAGLLSCICRVVLLPPPSRPLQLAFPSQYSLYTNGGPDNCIPGPFPKAHPPMSAVTSDTSSCMVCLASPWPMQPLAPLHHTCPRLAIAIALPLFPALSCTALPMRGGWRTHQSV